MIGGGPTRTGRDDDDPGRRDFRFVSGGFGSPSFVVGKLYVSSRGFGEQGYRLSHDTSQAYVDVLLCGLEPIDTDCPD